MCSIFTHSLTTGVRSWGRVGAQKHEILTYHPHTRTPITKPHARRLEPITASPWPTLALHEQRHISSTNSNNLNLPSGGDTERIPLQPPCLKAVHAHSQPSTPLPYATSGDFWTSTQTPVAREDCANTALPFPRRSADGIKLSRHSQPPSPPQPPADLGEDGVAVSCEVDHAEWPRRAAITMAPHDIPLGSTPHVDGQHPTADEDSLWSRITSVSRRGLGRIYGFLTQTFPGPAKVSQVRSKPGQMTGWMTGLTQSPDSGHFSPGGGAGPPP